MTVHEGDLTGVSLTAPDVPIHAFPGDEQVNVPYSEALTYDPKGHRSPYIAAHHIIRALNDHTEVMVDRPTLEHARRVGFWVDGVDWWLDRPGLSAEERRHRHDIGESMVQHYATSPTDGPPFDVTEVLGAKYKPLGGVIHYWGNSIRAMREPYRTEAGKQALGCIQLSWEKGQADNVFDYIDVVFREGRACGLLFAATAFGNQENRNDGQFEAFSDWLGKFVGRMCIMGAAFDLHADYKHGLLGFKPAPVREGLALLRASVADPETFSFRIARRLLLNSLHT